MLSPVVKQVFPQQGAHKLRLPQLFQPLQGGGKLPAGKGILLSLAFQRPDLPLQKGDAIGASTLSGGVPFQYSSTWPV